MQQIKAKRFSFTKLLTGSILSKSKRLNQHNSKQSNIYARCSDLPLNLFIDCIVDNKFESLIISGNPTQKELIENWENIFIEYCELSNTPHYSKTISLLRDLGTLKTKLFIIETCIVTLSNTYNQKLIDTLKDLGYKYDFDYSNKHNYLADLFRISQNKKTIEITILQKEKEYKELTESNKNTSKITREYFIKILIQLSKWMGGAVIHANQISVIEYVTILNGYTEEMKLINKNNGK